MLSCRALRPLRCVGLRPPASTAARRRAVSSATSVPRVALMFPGQGAQRVGMGKELCRDFACARHVFEEVDEALGERLSRLMTDGLEADLNATANTQPAILAHSVATLRVLQRELPEAVRDAHLVMGHSVGEYAALVAVDALSLTDAARLLRLRGLLMQHAADAFTLAQGKETCMMACMVTPAPDLDHPARAPAAAAAELARLHAAVAAATPAGGVVALAAYNAPKQCVLSGDAPSVAAVVEALRARGALKRAARLPVSAPFHCDIMAPAAHALHALLTRAPLAPPPPPPRVAAALRACEGVQLNGARRAAVLTNSDVALAHEAGALADALVRGITRPVPWLPAALAAASAHGVGAFIEVGPGATLTGLVRAALQAWPHVTAAATDSPTAIAQLQRAWTAAAAAAVEAPRGGEVEGGEGGRTVEGTL